MWRKSKCACACRKACWKSMLRCRQKKRNSRRKVIRVRSGTRIEFLCVLRVLCVEILVHEMKADIVTIFPDFFRGPLDHGITRRACELGLAKIEVHDLRKFTHDRHRSVDDRPFGGGEGMVLKPEPLFECLESLQMASRAERLGGAAKQA